MYRTTPIRRTRGHASIANAVSPEIRADRGATLAERDRQIQIARAEDDFKRAKEALEKAQSLSVENAALAAATARLAELRGETAPESKNIESKKKKAA